MGSQGGQPSRETAFRIMEAAVARYKLLCDSTVAGESKFATFSYDNSSGTKVEHVQNIEGVKFYYYPPPKNANRDNKDHGGLS